jgi:SAM-dependent methyltransferase
MRLRGLRRHWNEYGKRDPLWAILTAPDKKGNRWSIDEFLQTGRDEIAQLMTSLDERRITVARGRALDFGCGAGRLTHALAAHFDHAIGLDIAPSMVAKAREIHAALPNVEFRVNASDRLESIESDSIDLVYTRLVLQHMPPRYIRAYLAEFARVLRPGGLAVFQLPGEHARPVAATRGGLKGLLPGPVISMIRAVRDLRDFPRMELHGLPRAEVERLMASHGAPVVDAVDDRAHGADTPGFRYFAVKITPPRTAASARPTSSM